MQCILLLLRTHSAMRRLCRNISCAILTVDRGQMEAAYSVGLSGSQAFMRIVFPQAIRVAFPNIANTMISSLKDTSLAFSIGVMDMVGGRNLDCFYDTSV